MFGVGHPVVDIVTGRAVDGQILPVVECLVGRAAGGREYERETLTLRCTVVARTVRFFKQDAGWTGPVLTERRVPYFIEKVQVLDGGVIDAERRTNAGFSR